MYSPVTLKFAYEVKFKYLFFFQLSSNSHTEYFEILN